MPRTAIKSFAHEFSLAADGSATKVFATGVGDYPGTNAILIKAVRYRLIDIYTTAWTNGYCSLNVSIGNNVQYALGDKRNIFEQAVVGSAFSFFEGDFVGIYVPPNNLIVANDYITAGFYSQGCVQPHGVGIQIFYEFIKIPLADELFLNID